MPLKTLSLFILLLCLGKAYGQRQNVYFFKNSGSKVSTKDSADYIRIVKEPDTGTTNYNVEEYYKNGKPKFAGKSSKIDPLVLEGQCMSYYPSGKKRSLVNYTFGLPDGDTYYFFPNGKLYAYKKYLLEKPNPKAFRNAGTLIMASSDSTGKELVVDGNGHYIGYEDANKNPELGPLFFSDFIVNYDFTTVAEEGDVKAGFKDGKWKSTYTLGSDRYTLIENFENGKFISGESKNAEGQSVRYTMKGQQPEYPGGTTAFNMFLGQHVRYPEEARRSGIQGAVYVAFTVEKDGSLSDIKAVKSPNSMLSRAAIEAVKQSPKWTPGLINGRAARVEYTVPVNFTLGRP